MALSTTDSTVNETTTLTNLEISEIKRLSINENELQTESKQKEKENLECSINVDDYDDDVESVISVDDDDTDISKTKINEGIEKTDQENRNDIRNTITYNGNNENNVKSQENAANNNDEMYEERDLFQNSIIELGRKLWDSSTEKQHYTKGCLWSPDGTCLLVAVHLDGMHIVELPSDLYNVHEINKERNVSSLSTAVHVKEGGTVYDFAWYPFMNSNDPASCCWIATRQHEPIHMWDAFTGDLRCTYRGYDEVDEVEAAISVIFNPDGDKIFGGYKKSLKVFDTNIPGRDCVNIPVKQTISCMAVTTTNDKCVTTGSWNGFIYHYDIRSPRLGSLFALSAHSGGVTWLRYHSVNDNTNWHLFSGARKDDRILEWDMRNYSKPVEIFKRNVTTNQRIYFDLDLQHNNWLISGDTQGYLKVWNLHDTSRKAEIPLHNDCCNGVNLHPTLPVLATTSGQYHFINVINEDKDKTNNSLHNNIIIEYENCLLLTWLGSSY